MKSDHTVSFDGPGNSFFVVLVCRSNYAEMRLHWELANECVRIDNEDIREGKKPLTQPYHETIFIHAAFCDESAKE